MSKVATRERILDGALDVFACKGYHRAIVDDIVRASGTSKGALRTLAWLGAVNEIALTRLLLRSIGSPA